VLGFVCRLCVVLELTVGVKLWVLDATVWVEDADTVGKGELLSREAVRVEGKVGELSEDSVGEGDELILCPAIVCKHPRNRERSRRGYPMKVLLTKVYIF